MSTRKSTRIKKVPEKYRTQNDSIGKSNVEDNLDSLNAVDTHHENKTNGTLRTTSSSASRRRKLQIELEKQEEINKLEKEIELKEIERQKHIDEMDKQNEELERQREERQRKAEEVELQRQRKALELQREMELRELGRQKRLLEMRAELNSASVGSRSDNNSEVGSNIHSINDNLEEDPQSRVDKWLNDKEHESNVGMSSSAIVSSAVEKLADTFRQALHVGKPDSCNLLRQNLPSFSGKPGDWPIFYSSYKKTMQYFSEEDNLIRIRNCLEGDAYKMVKPLFISGKNLNAVIKTLQIRYGRPDLILESLQRQTKMLPPVKEDDINGLIEFTTNVLNFSTTAESLEMENYMTNPQLLMELLDKLPYNLRYSWAKHVNSLCLSKPNLKDLSTWLDNECALMSIYFRPQPENVTRRKIDTKPIFTNSTIDKKIYSCMFCNDKHESAECKTFRKAEVTERWKMVAEKKLCFFCFRQHQIKFCKVKKPCGINNCKLFHHRLLHTDKLERTSLKTGNEESLNKVKEVNSKHSELSVTKSVLLRVCPVTLYGPNCQLDTFALLDDGSTVSLLDSSTAQELGLQGETYPLTTCWSNMTRHFDPTSKQVDVKIKGLYEDEIFTLNNVRTQSPLDLPLQTVDTVKLRRTWSHLNSIDQPLPSATSKPTLLIGQDNCNLMLTRKVVEGPSNSPVLSWSLLGWSLHGRCPDFRDRVDENFILFTSFENQSLHNLVKESFEIDNYGASKKEDLKFNIAHKDRATKILEETTRKVGERYESGLLWKTDTFKFPPSYESALKRLKNIEGKMKKDPNFQREYKKKIADYLEKGYIRKLNQDEARVVNDRTYYLPHFGVVNPNKPNKLRLVFDAAAKSNGISFNDGLLNGPDLLNPLPAVLMKFRLGKIAIAGDIKEMFHQVLIKKEDTDSQRFLWRETPFDQPDTYIMNVMIFGSTCSPSTALYVVNHNARRFLTVYPEASNSILKKEYMDDLLDSTDSEEEARRRVQEIIEIHKSGGFQICNWMSNSLNVLQDIPEELKSNSAKQLNLESSLATERVLGMWWEAKTDSFVFYRNAERIKKMETCYPTKREVLRATMSIFDPLGLVVPTTIKGRMLVQEIWRSKLTWDEVLSPDLTKKWTDWLTEVQNIQTLKIPRSYFWTLKTEELELHCFVDASEESYSAVAYLRQEKCDHLYKTALVFARAKVTPLKPTTIPRLELQAAVLGCRLAKSIEHDIDICITRRVFWSDSVTVLHWIKSDPKTFKPFVANRISETQELSKAEEWKWVPSKQNPADIATRSSRKFTLKTQEEWVNGPKFLEQEESHWPEQPQTLQLFNNEEKKLKFIGLHKEEPVNIIEVEKFSSWEKLLRVTTWVLKYMNKLRSRIVSTSKQKLQVKSIDYKTIAEIQVDEIKEAEKIIIKMSQDASFFEEKSLLLKSKPLPKSSGIFSLLPFLDEDGLLRMSSRTCNSSDQCEETKQPYILDGKSHTARLMVKMYHEKCFHQGTDTVMNMTRERFWISRLRTLVKKVQSSCMRCKIDKTKPNPPQMAPLPASRVSRVEHPFFYTGIDYFGPIEVTVGRRHEKRYGVIFTCLSTRAVHLEIAHSLNTESCVMAIQRFISRKPCPSEIFSDNGTNFIATEKELQAAVKSLSNTQIQRSIARNGIKWNFIPPRAPHMGGCWERLIRSVKTALKSVMKNQFPKDEELQTFMVRVEFIINSRPLTHVSIDPQDPDPITPNHFLREAFKVDINENVLCKRQLARVRTLLDGFWKRWIHEYLPCLSRRCKWHNRIKPPSVGDFAIIIEDNSPRNTWPLGRIAAIYPSKDGQVRVVDVDTSKGTFRRPLTKVAVLTSEEEMM